MATFLGDPSTAQSLSEQMIYIYITLVVPTIAFPLFIIPNI